MSLEIVADEILSDDYHLLRKITYSHPRIKGGHQVVTREVFERGEASAILLWHKDRNSLIFVRQLRLPVALLGDDAHVLEAAAGGMDKGETPLSAALREGHEETGYAVSKAQFVCVIHPSPAAVKERLFLYFAEVDDSLRTGTGGGLEHESEDVEVVEIAVDEVRKMLDEGRFSDAKTLVLLYWFFARLR
jgi:nudix-type nucleoside diphosphatase (YffH/AdpP family)